MVTKTQRLTLRHLITQFIQRRNLAPKTRDSYLNILSNFEWYTRTNNWPSLEGITRDHIRQFLDYVATEEHRWPESRRPAYKKASPGTIHHYGRSVKSLFNWAEEEGYLDSNPIHHLKLGSPHYKDVKPYTDEEVYAMLDVCESDIRFRYRYLGIRNKAIISLFVATGLRLSELANIRLSDLDPRLQQLQVMGKGAKMRMVPIDGEARKALKHYLEFRPRGGDELWKTDDGEVMSSWHSIKSMVTRIKRRAGVNSGGGVHRFRHYFATRFLEAGGDLNILRLLLGHSTLAMVLKYSRFVDVRKALANHEQFSPLDRLYNQQNHRRGWR